MTRFLTLLFAPIVVGGICYATAPLWESAIKRAKESGEIRQDLVVEDIAMLFRQVFFGLSFEQSFLKGLDIKRLARELHFVYSLLKA